MGIAVFMSVTFVVCFVVIYIAMHVSCFLKKQYCNAENWFSRAIMFALILATAITLTAHYVR
jgi:heme/copper-type cytochrome/quinol oxidase subunit 4